MRDGRRWAWGALAIAVGLAVLSPHPQLLQYMLLACRRVRAVSRVRRPTRRRGVARHGALAVQRLALRARRRARSACAIGAVQYLPVREYVAWSPRAAGRAGSMRSSYSLPLEELLNMYLPQFTRHPRQVLGSQRHPLPQRVPRRGRARARGRRVRWIAAERGFPALLDRRARRVAALGARRDHAVLPASSTRSCRGRSSSARRARCIYVFAFCDARCSRRSAPSARCGVSWTQRYVLGWVVGGLLLAAACHGRCAPRNGGRRGASERRATRCDAGHRSRCVSQVGDQFAERANVNATDVILGAWRSLLCRRAARRRRHRVPARTSPAASARRRACSPRLPSTCGASSATTGSSRRRRECSMPPIRPSTV